MTEAMPIGAPMTHPVPTGVNALDVIISLCVLVPLLSLAYDIVKREWNQPT